MELTPAKKASEFVTGKVRKAYSELIDTEFKQLCQNTLNVIMSQDLRA